MTSDIQVYQSLRCTLEHSSRQSRPKNRQLTAWYQPVKQIERVGQEKVKVLAGPSCVSLFAGKASRHSSHHDPEQR